MKKNLIGNYINIFYLLSLVFFFLIFFTKLILYLKGYCNHDILMYSNALFNTNLKTLLSTDLSNFQYAGSPGKSYFLDHFSPTLLFLSPIYKLFPTPILLLFIQTIIPIISSYIILLICRELKISPIFSLLFSLVYLFCIINVLGTIDGVYGFHHDTLLPLFFFTCCYSYLKKKKYLFFFSLFLMLGIKEDILFYSFFIFLINFIYFNFLKKSINKFRSNVLTYSILISLILIMIFFSTNFYLRGSFFTPHISFFLTPDNSSIEEVYNIKKLIYFFFSLKWWLIILSFVPSLFGIPYFIYSYPFIYNFGSYYPDIGTFLGLQYTYHWIIILCIISLSAILNFSKINKFAKNKKLILTSLTIFFFFCSFSVGLYRSFSKFNKALDKPYLHNVNSVEEVIKIIPREEYLFVSLPIRHKFINRRHLVKTVNTTKIFGENTSDEILTTNEKINYFLFLKNNIPSDINKNKNKFEILYNVSLTNFSKNYENEEIILFKRNER